MEKQELIALIDRYLNGQASEAEQEMITNYFHSFQTENQWDEARFGLKQTAVHQIIEHIKESIKVAGGDAGTIIPAPAEYKIHFMRRAWVRYAAAVILLIGGLGVFFVFKPSKLPTETASVKVLPDIQPASKKAYLTLGDGKQVILENVQAGEKIGDATKMADGKLEYAKAKGQAIVYNTLTVPRGGAAQYVKLPDGTQVWLNTASSITYPTAFSGKERSVSMTGEAYFEVTKTGQQFIVQTRSDKIEVLGTHFNIHAYAEEQTVKTTLLEGKVRIGNTILAPGEQFSNGKVVSANIEQVMAWKNGLFSYSNVDVQTLMRDLARWYDVEVVFEGTPVSRRFEGEIGRSLTLKQVLTGLSFKEVNYRIETTADGKNRIVMLP